MECSLPEICYCGKTLKRSFRTAPNLIGGRDSFGIGKEFYDKRTGKYIDNYSSWEKAGFRNPLESSNLSDMDKKIIKEKQRVIKNGTKLNRSVHPEDV